MDTKRTNLSDAELITEYLNDPNSVSAMEKAALDAIGPWLLRKRRDQLLIIV